MLVNGERIWSRIEELGKIGITPEGGISRFAFSPEDKLAITKCIAWMREAGLKVRMDSVGNIYGRREGKENGPVVLTGSHLDTVINGGKFDGAAGVVAAIETLQVIEEQRIHTRLPIEIVIFVNEEGSRFSGGMMGSLAVTGCLAEDFPYKIKDNSGTLLAYEMKKYGAQPEYLNKARRKPGELKVFYELHIEQGNVLDDKNIPVGIVTGIAGPHQMKLKLFGRSGHAGGMLMKGRRDPLIAAAKIIQEVERASIEASEATRGTVGNVVVYPGGHNIIPGVVELTLDFRDININSRNQVVERVKKYIYKVCEERGLTHELIDTQNVEPIVINDIIIDLIDKAAKDSNITTIKLPSGAAHDAMIMSRLCPIGMIFVRSRGGLSHCPEEYTTKEDLAMGTQVLLNVLIKSADEVPNYGFF
ncbi:MAG: M20 family metallo-hydrolase [Firmicutes bacterium]|nr:M20 family metallo-hydrolase [Bacillota bacterium]